MKRIATHLTEKQIKTLEALSQRTGLPRAELIRRFIDQGIESYRSTDALITTVTVGGTGEFYE